jgi:hypothetical protein
MTAYDLLAHIQPSCQISPMATIYMPLLNEGTDVWRPVEALHIMGDRYQIADAVPEGEEWAFAPGSYVTCGWKVFSDGQQALIAICCNP